MDIIIEADPEAVSLLFRRPLKETLQQGVQQRLNAALKKDNPKEIKWVDEEKDKSRKKKKKDKRRSKRDSEEEDTLQSSVASSYKKSSGRRKKSRSRKDPYESESFLDLLIDSICSNSNNVCRDTFRREYDDFSDEESFPSEDEEETYATYEESLDQQPRKAPKKRFEEPVEEAPRRSNSRKKERVEKAPTYDETLETEEDHTNDRVPSPAPRPVIPEPPVVPPPLEEEAPVGAPIREVQYDDRFDPGADVSVMESLGGPSLLLERQRLAAAKPVQQVPADILEHFGLDYPANFGMSRRQTIEKDPIKFYAYVVKQLLEEHEPEKVRLLDKLLAKYEGREDHLVQKLSVRYNKDEEDPDDNAFTDAVQKSKATANVEAAVHAARDRVLGNEDEDDEDAPEAVPLSQEWPEKEEKEADHGDDEASVDDSNYSGDSVDGTSPAVIAQVSEMLNYVYGKTSVPAQIDRVSQIMRAYEGREAVLLELLETKALIKANKEKENSDALPAFLRHSSAQRNVEEMNATDNLTPVTPMATQPGGAGTVINDDISSMSGVSSPAHPPGGDPNGVVSSEDTEDVEVTHLSKGVITSMKGDGPKIHSTLSKGSTRPPATPDKKKKKGLFGGLFGKKKKDGSTTPGRANSRRKLRGVTSVEGSI